MKEDVESVVVEKKPKNCVGNIIYLTDGPTDQKTAANRKTLHRDEEFIVEDVVDPSGEVTRRLVGVKNYLRPQAQVILDYQNGHLEPDSHQWGLLKAASQKQPAKNPKMLDYAYNRALFLAISAFGKHVKKKGALIGLGSGIVGDFLHHYRPDVELTEVEKSAAVIDLARRFFFYSRQAIHKDGADYIEEQAEGSLDFIIVDADDTLESEGSVPPKCFCNHKFIAKAYSSLSEGGVLALVVVPKTSSQLKELQEELHHVFGFGFDMPALREEFHVYIAIKTKDADSQDWKKGSKKRLVDVKASWLKSSNEDWEENEFTDLAEGVTSLPTSKEETMTK